MSANCGLIISAAVNESVDFQGLDNPIKARLFFPKILSHLNPIKSHSIPCKPTIKIQKKSSSGHWNLQLGLQGQAQGWHATWVKTCQVRGALWRVFTLCWVVLQYIPNAPCTDIYQYLPYKSPECRYIFHTWSIWAFAKLVPMSPRINVSFFWAKFGGISIVNGIISHS